MMLFSDSLRLNQAHLLGNNPAKPPSTWFKNQHEGNKPVCSGMIHFVVKDSSYARMLIHICACNLQLFSYCGVTVLHLTFSNRFFSICSSIGRMDALGSLCKYLSQRQSADKALASGACLQSSSKGTIFNLMILLSSAL